MLVIKHEFLIAARARGSHQAPADKCCLNEKTFFCYAPGNSIMMWTNLWQGNCQTLQTFKKRFFSNVTITIGQITIFWPRITYHKDKAHFLITPT